eukprot:2549586-Prymnesium_polylepis.1
MGVPLAAAALVALGDRCLSDLWRSVSPRLASSCHVVRQSVARDAAAFPVLVGEMVGWGGRLDDRENRFQRCGGALLSYGNQPAASWAKMATFGKRGQYVAKATFPVATLLLMNASLLQLNAVSRPRGFGRTPPLRNLGPHSRGRG